MQMGGTTHCTSLPPNQASNDMKSIYWLKREVGVSNADFFYTKKFLWNKEGKFHLAAFPPPYGSHVSRGDLSDINDRL